jgi:hypothetical protein
METWLRPPCRLSYFKRYNRYAANTIVTIQNRTVSLIHETVGRVW